MTRTRMAIGATGVVIGLYGVAHLLVDVPFTDRPASVFEIAAVRLVIARGRFQAVSRLEAGVGQPPRRSFRGEVSGDWELNVGSFNVTAPILVPYTFSGGMLHLTNSPLTIGAGGLLGANVATSSTRSIVIDQSTTLSALGLLSIAGGTFSTGAFVNNA